MTVAKVEFHRLAEKDYDDAINWYSEHSPSAAQRFKEAVDKAVLRISHESESMPRMSGPYRWVRVHRFRYILVFRERQLHDLVVVAVAHTSRRPGYWRRRT